MSRVTSGSSIKNCPLTLLSVFRLVRIVNYTRKLASARDKDQLKIEKARRFSAGLECTIVLQVQEGFRKTRIARLESMVSAQSVSKSPYAL